MNLRIGFRRSASWGRTSFKPLPLGKGPLDPRLLGYRTAEHQEERSEGTVRSSLKRSDYVVVFTVRIIQY
jgi:hypothetical protein